MRGSVYPRCFCRDPNTRKPLGGNAPNSRPRDTPQAGSSGMTHPAALTASAASPRSGPSQPRRQPRRSSPRRSPGSEGALRCPTAR